MITDSAIVLSVKRITYAKKTSETGFVAHRKTPQYPRDNRKYWEVKRLLMAQIKKLNQPRHLPQSEPLNYR